MIKSLITFIVKAAPRFIGEMMKNPKNVTKLFKKSGEKLAKSKFYSKATDFIGQTPGAWAKECARNAVSQSATNLMMGAITGGFTKLFSGGGGKQYSFPSKTSGNTVGGYKAPGIQTTNAAQASNVRAFNQTSRTLGNEANKQLKIRQQQKKVIDRYRKNIQRKNFSIGEITSLSNRLEKELQRQKTSLLSGLKSGKHSADGLSRIQPPKQIKQPTQIPKEQQPLATYTKEALDEMNKQMQENIKAVNENISKSIASMNRKEEEIAQKMMANLGNYNTVAYKKLADTMTKTEEVSFQKQQESAYYQTDMLADKLDNDHDYSSKQLGVLRSEVLGNTQTMYELDKQNRMIEENYRALEEKKNNGFTVGTIGALLTQTYQMVQNSLKTPDIINDNVDNAMKKVAFTAGEEVGKLIQMFKELINGFRAALRGLYMKIPEPLNKTLAPFIGMLDWVNDRVFRGLLGADDSVVEDVFGTPGTLSFLDEQKDKKEYGDTIGDNKTSSKRIVTTGYAGTLFGGGGKHGFNNAAATMPELFDTNWEIDEKKKTVNVMTNSGYSVTLKHDKRDDETLEEYKQRKKIEAVDRETNENFTYKGNGAATRDNAQQSRDRLNQVMKEIETASVKRSGKQGPKYLLDFTYDVISYKVQPSCPHSEPPATDKEQGKNEQNCINILNDSFFDRAWGGGMYDSIALKGGLKMRVLKALKEASEKGIKYQITSTFRTPSCYYGYTSPHHLGIAVDIAIEGMADAIPKCWSQAGNYDPYSYGTYWSVILTSEDLDAIINRTQWKEGADETLYDLFVQWGELQEIFSANHLSVGVDSFQIASDARGITNGTKRLDMVHIQVAEQATVIDSPKQQNKDLMNKSLSEIIGAKGQDKLDKKINEGVGLDYNLRMDEFEKNLFGNIEGIKQKENTKIAGIGKEDMDYFYTDQHGNIMQEYMTGNMSVKDFKRDKDGKVVRREKDDIEKQIKTDTGMMLLDKFRNGTMTPEEKEQVKKLVEEYNKLDPEAQKKSQREKEMKDITYVYNTFNNTTVVDNKSELSTGNESNIPQ